MFVVGAVHDGQNLLAGETAALEFVEPLEEKRRRPLLLDEVVAEERDVVHAEPVSGGDSRVEGTAVGNGFGDGRHVFFSRASDYEERGFCGRLLFGQILKFQFWVGCVIFSGDFS